MLRLYLQIDGELADCYREALRRVCEVELTGTLADADAVITQECSASDLKPALWIPGTTVPPRGSHIMPAARWRFEPYAEAIAGRLREGKLGEPGLLRIHRWRSSADLLEDIDLAVGLFSNEPERLYAVARDGCLQAHLGFAGGGMAIIAHATELPGDGYESVSLIGSHGAAYADDHRNTNLHIAAAGCQGLTLGSGNASIVALLDAFVTAVRTNSSFVITMSAIETALRVRDRVTHSLMTGAAV